MKPLHLLILYALFCTPQLFAESTLELIQQRAQAGDATAQTFLGMAYFYGHTVSQDPAKALFWFEKAAKQGDEFAAKRCNLKGQNIHIATRTTSVSDPLLETKVNQGQSAPYAGKVTFDELVLHRNQYLGKVIHLNFTPVSVVGGMAQYIYARDPRSQNGHIGASEELYLHGESALKWRLQVEKKGYGNTSNIYALVEKDKLIALGSRKHKADNSYSYQW